MEARELGERFRADSDGFTEYATQVPITDAEIDGDSFYVHARQLLGGMDGELRIAARCGRAHQALGDRALQYGGGGERAWRSSEPVAEPLRGGITP